MSDKSLLETALGQILIYFGDEWSGWIVDVEINARWFFSFEMRRVIWRSFVLKEILFWAFLGVLRNKQFFFIIFVCWIKFAKKPSGQS